MAILPTVDNLRGVLQKVIFVPIVYGFISLLPMFLSAWENSDRLADRLFTVVRSKENMFDFVIVGGGTAGALVASRLAEHYKVLLLEAGGTPSPFQTIPALALKFLNHPQTDWSYKTVPQRKACLNSINQQSSWSAGRGLGGTTNINFMSHVRGHTMDFDAWSSKTGDPTWGYAGVLPYFKRSETFSGTSNDPDARGHEGELKIRKPSYIGLSEDWIRAGQELGYPFVDLNGRYEEGFGMLQYPIYKGIRQSTYSAFLLPYHKSPRLTIRRYSLVRKVLFRDNNNMAYGVEYVRHGHIETVIATKEVILSAGTMGSTKLLMLSGIGPRAHLEELGIPVRSDLPVGHNLQDHLAVHLGPFFIKESKAFLFDRDVRPENIIRWLFLGTGPITTTGYQGAASIASSVAKSQGEGNWPDLHLILHGQAIHQGYVDAFAYAYSLQEDELMQYYSNAVGRDSFHITIVGSRPTSSGQVLLGGSSISDNLVINPKYLEDGGGNDFKTLLEGVKFALSIAQNTSAFRRLGTEFTTAKLPGCYDFEIGSDAYWECYIRRYTISMNNPVGTVALGDVVDHLLRVRGTRGLRVVDASIQPTIVSTGIAASTLMIAEKGADMILKDHGIPDRDTDFFDLVFGRNGFIKKNPFLRILQREFDTINPLRAIFKPFTTATEPEERDRFTRNGRVDNPFLQVISSVFGNANQQTQKNRADASASGSSNVNVVDSGGGAYRNPVNVSVLSRKSSEEMLDGAPSNVISKNQWVLQTALSNLPKNPGTKAVSSPSGSVVSLNSPVVDDGADMFFSSTRPPKTLKSRKGGRRYALLQAIWRQQNATREWNATIPHEPQVLSSAPPPTTSTTTTPTPLQPVVEVVTFQNSPLNLTENEIVVDEPIGNTNKTPPFVVAKPVAHTPTVFNLFQLTNNNSNNKGSGGEPLIDRNANLFGLPNWNPQSDPKASTTTPNPLTGLLDSLNTFSNFMDSFNSKTAAEMDFINGKNKDAKPVVSPPQNLFKIENRFGSKNNNNNDNILSGFLSALGGAPPKNKPVLFGETPDAEPSRSTTTINPFSFLFGNSLSTAATTPPPPSLTTTTSPPNPFNFLGGNSLNTNSNNNNNIFSSWFKPTSNNPQTSSSWFKPLNDPSSQQLNSWFKPLPFNQETSSNWFQALTQPQTTTAPPPNPLETLADLFLGDLKKSERKKVTQTLGAMFPGQNMLDFLGSMANKKPKESGFNIFDLGAAAVGSGNGADLLSTMITLGKMMNSFQQPTTRAPNIFDNILNAFNPSTPAATTTPRPSLLDIFLKAGG